MSVVGSASRRYLRRFVSAMLAYAALLIGLVPWLRGAGSALPPATRYLLAVVPAVPILVVLWALGRLLVEEADEVNRARCIQQLLWGAATALSASTVWGFLEVLADAPHLPAYWVFPVFCLGMGLSLPYVWRKYS